MSFEENLQMFSRFAPHYIERIQKSKEEENPHQENFLEAERWFVELLLHPNVEALVVWGLGCGECFFAAQDWLEEDPKRLLVLLEDNAAIICHFLQRPEAQKILSHPQVVLHPMEAEASDLLKQLKIPIELLIDSPYLFTISYPYNKTRQQKGMEIQKTLQLKISQMRWLYRCFTLQHLCTDVENVVHNTRQVPFSKAIQPMKGSLKDVPILICGAGPSLASEIPLIQAYQNQVLIAAAGSAMNVLNAHNIFPHFGVGVDPGPSSFSRVRTNTAFETPFFYRLRFSRDALKILHGEKILFKGVCIFAFEKWIEEQLGMKEWESVHSPISTTHATLGIAHYLGCSPIILAGVDLAYTEGARYSSGVITHPLDSEKEEKLLQTPSKGNQMWVKGIKGKKVATYIDWMWEAEEYAKFAAEHPGLKCINATSEGCYLPEWETRSLTEAFASIESLDAENLLHAALQNSSDHLCSPEKQQKILLEAKTRLETFEESLMKTLLQVQKGGLSSLKNALQKIQKSFEEEKEGFSFFAELWEIYGKTQGKELYFLNMRPEIFTEKEQFEKLLKFETNRIFYVLKLSRFLLHSIQQQQKNPKAPTFSSYHKQTLESLLEGTEYTFDSSRFSLFDHHLALDWEEIAPELEEQTLYYPSGAVKTLWYTKKGMLHGPSRCFADSGTLLSEGWFLDNQKQGVNIQYDAKGNLYSFKRYLENACHGKHLSFYPSGALKSSIPYEKGVLNGTVVLYYSNGQPKREITFVKGKKMGVEREWTEEGKQVVEVCHEAEVLS